MHSVPKLTSNKNTIATIIRRMASVSLVSLGIVVGSHLLFLLIVQAPRIEVLYPFSSELIAISVFLIFVAIMFLYLLNVLALPRDVFPDITTSTISRYFDWLLTLAILGKLSSVLGKRKRSFIFWLMSVVLLLLLVGAVVFFLIFAYRLLAPLVTAEAIARNNLVLTALLVFAILQTTLRKKRITRQSWKKLTDVWLKMLGVSALSTGGFGFAGLQLKDSLFKNTIKAGIVDIDTTVIIYIVSLLVLGIAQLCINAGKSSAGDENSQEPKFLFLTSFILVWVGSLGMHTLFINSMFLTLHAYLTTKA